MIEPRFCKPPRNPSRSPLARSRLQILICRGVWKRNSTSEFALMQAFPLRGRWHARKASNETNKIMRACRMRGTKSVQISVCLEKLFCFSWYFFVFIDDVQFRKPFISTYGVLLILRKRSPFPAGEGTDKSQFIYITIVKIFREKCNNFWKIYLKTQKNAEQGTKRPTLRYFFVKISFFK